MSPTASFWGRMRRVAAALCWTSAVLWLSGCGLVEYAALKPFETSSVIHRDDSREDILAAAEKHPMDALVSPAFYRAAGTEDVARVIGGRNLEGKTVRNWRVTTSSPLGTTGSNPGGALLTPMVMSSGLTYDTLDPVTIALEYSPHPGVIRLLGEAGCDLSGRMPHYILAGPRQSDPEIMQLLLEHDPCPHNPQYLFKHLLVRGIDPRCLKIFLDLAHNFDVNTPLDDYGATALMDVAERGDLDFIHVLLMAGADLEARDRNGEKAIGYALRRGKVDMVKLFVELGADCSYVTREGSLQDKVGNAEFSDARKKRLLRLLSG